MKKIVLALMILGIIILNGCVECSGTDIIQRFDFVDCESDGARKIYHVDYDKCRRVCCISHLLGGDTCDSECMYDCHEEIKKFEDMEFCIKA